jgi:hypothetical protein
VRHAMLVPITAAALARHPVAERRDSAPAQPGVSPCGYFFNIKDGATILDEQGIEFDNMQAVKNEAVRSSADLLKAFMASTSGRVSRGNSG